MCLVKDANPAASVAAGFAQVEASGGVSGGNHRESWSGVAGAPSPQSCISLCMLSGEQRPNSKVSSAHVNGETSVMARYLLSTHTYLTEARVHLHPKYVPERWCILPCC